MTEKQYLLGVDGGGTKTLAVVADTDGNVLGFARTDPTNFQIVGVTGAKRGLKDAVEQALAAADLVPDDIAHATYGISGADRERDFDTVHSFVEPVNPAPQYLLCNDTTIALRAGTPDGVGIALIAGTGANTIGFNRDYDQKKVGGLGPFTGDYGSAGDLAQKAMVAAMKGYDGRGPKTVIEQMFCEALNVEEIVDIIEFSFIEHYRPISIREFAPLPFRAAKMGDKVALRLLTQTGKEVGHEAVTCAKALFKKDEAFDIILAGSVFQKGEHPAMIDAMTAHIKRRFPNANIHKLEAEPCVGALLWSYQLLRGKQPTKKLVKTLSTNLHRAMRTTA